MAKPLTTDEWVQRLNALGREMDEWAASLHPSTWGEQMEELEARYRKLAEATTCDDAQLALPTMRIIMNYSGPGWWPDEPADYSDPNKILPQTPNHDKKAMRQPVGDRQPQTRREKAKRKRRRKTSKASRKINRRRS